MRRLVDPPARAGNPSTTVAVLIAIAAFLLYAATAVRGVAWDDGGELAAGITRLGIVHPDGYPAYVLGGWILTHIVPFGSGAFKASLWSALAGACAIGGVAYYVHRRTNSLFGALLGAGTLATGGLFWNQATQPSVYPLFVLSIILLLIAAERWYERPEPTGLAFLAAATGLVAVSHRSGLVFLPFAAGLVAGRARRELIMPANLAATGAFLVPWLTALYIPARSHAAGFPNQLQAGHTTWWHLVTGPGLPYDQPFKAGLHTVFTNAFNAVLLIPAELSLAAVLLVPLGIWSLRRDRPFIVTGLAPALAVSAIVATTNGSYAFWHLPLLAICAVAAGCGVPALRLGARRTLRPPGLALIAAAALTGTIAGIVFMANHGADASSWARAVLGALPPGAHVTAPWSAYAPLRAMQELDHRRPDVTVALAHHWPTGPGDLKRAARAGDYIVAMNSGPAPRPAGLRLQPVGPAGRVQRKGMTGLSFLGHRLGDVQYRARAFAAG